jgi:hypothetical protein
MITGATINALDYGMSTTATAAQNKAALQAAIAVFANIPYGGNVYIPTGIYEITGDINITTSGVQITGEKSQYLYGVSSGLKDFAQNGGTCLVFTSGTYGFNATSNYFRLSNILVDGNNATTIGVACTGMNQFTNVTFSKFTNIGLYLENYTNTTLVENCCAVFNGTGIKSVGAQTTPFIIRTCNIRSNGIGIDISGGTLIKIDKCIIESNTSLGLYVNALTGTAVGEIVVDNTWFENNSSVANSWAVIITGADTPADVYNVCFKNCLFDTQSKLDVLFQKGTFHQMERCRFSLGQTINVSIGATTAYTQILMCNRGIGTGTAATNVSDSGLFTYIQDFPYHFVGKNLITSWTNDGANPYGGFVSVQSSITTANQASAVTSKANSNTWTTGVGQTYIISMPYDNVTGQLATLVVRNGDNTANLLSVALPDGGGQYKFTETVSGTSGYAYITNTAATQFGFSEPAKVYEMTRGYINGASY